MLPHIYIVCAAAVFCHCVLCGFFLCFGQVPALKNPKCHFGTGKDAFELSTKPHGDVLSALFQCARHIVEKALSASGFAPSLRYVIPSQAMVTFTGCSSKVVRPNCSVASLHELRRVIPCVVSCFLICTGLAQRWHETGTRWLCLFQVCGFVVFGTGRPCMW